MTTSEQRSGDGDGLAAQRQTDVDLALAAERNRARAGSGLPKPIGDLIGGMAATRDEAERLSAWARGVSVDRVRLEEGDADSSAASDRVIAARRARMVPARFTHARLANYTTSTPSQRLAFRAIGQWIDDARAGRGPILALIGDKGVGKSHLLYAAAHELLESRDPFYARPWYKLADELRYGGPNAFEPKLRDEAHEVRALLFRQRIVLIDEVRATAATAFDDTELAKLACAAYDDRVAVLITTNVSPLDLVMGAPAASRFVQVVIEGPDGRQA